MGVTDNQLGGDHYERACAAGCAASDAASPAADVSGADFWDTLPLGRGVELLAHDANGVAALHKPAGLLSHPNAAGDERRSLLCAPYDLRDECYLLGETGAAGEAAPARRSTNESLKEKQAAPRRLWLLNRLDSATSGLLLVCANRELAQVIRRTFRERRVHKTYVALVFGNARHLHSGGRANAQAGARGGASAGLLWRDRLSVDKRGGHIRTRAASSPARPRGTSVTAETRVRVLRIDDALSLLQLEPVTGRSHQLRVQCARRGLPIVGDATYGDFAANRAFAKAQPGTRGRLFLHALETQFDYAWRGRTHPFAARSPLPAEFEKS